MKYTLDRLVEISDYNKKNKVQTITVRFLKNGCNYSLEHGIVGHKGMNVFHQIVYWNNFTREQALDIARELQIKAIIN